MDRLKNRFKRKKVLPVPQKVNPQKPVKGVWSPEDFTLLASLEELDTTPKTAGLLEQLNILAEETKLLQRADENGIYIGECVFNLKGTDPADAESMVKFLRRSPIPLLSTLDSDAIRCALEAPGTVVGSGAAVVNTLRACTALDPGRTDCRPSLALLAAGQGSRLWGISAACGFVKGLCNTLGTTLIEQTVRQALLILAQAPNRGRDMILCAGTDNVVLPSRRLEIPTHCEKGTTLPFSMATDPKRNLFFFSQRVVVLDRNLGILSNSILRKLSQLGIMLLNEETGVPFLFLEKASPQEIVRVLREHKQQAVYYNVFYFAFTRPAARLVVELYGERLTSEGVPFLQAREFDWSSHVIEPLTVPTLPLWRRRYTDKQQKLLPHPEDWDLLWHAAQEFKETMGPPAVVDIGDEAIWYDAGMAADVKKLYSLAVSPNRPVLQGILRDLFNVSKAHVSESRLNSVRLPSQPFLVVNSEFKNGGSVGEGAVIINSVFEQETHVPKGCVVLDSVVYQLHPSSARDSIVYQYESTGAQPLRLLPGSVHFSVHVCSADRSVTAVESGVFPVEVVPKHTGGVAVLDHYNLGSNEGLTYLDQSILGFGEVISFNELLRERRVSLTAVVELLLQRREIAYVGSRL